MMQMVPFVTPFAYNPLEPVHGGIVVRTGINLEAEVAVFVLVKVLTTRVTYLYLLTVWQLHFTQTYRLFCEFIQLPAELEVVTGR